MREVMVINELKLSGMSIIIRKAQLGNFLNVDILSLKISDILEKY